jgi:hypothetical protein
MLFCDLDSSLYLNQWTFLSLFSTSSRLFSNMAICCMYHFTFGWNKIRIFLLENRSSLFQYGSPYVLLYYLFFPNSFLLLFIDVLVVYYQIIRNRVLLKKHFFMRLCSFHLVFFRYDDYNRNQIVELYFIKDFIS